MGGSAILQPPSAPAVQLRTTESTLGFFFVKTIKHLFPEHISFFGTSFFSFLVFVNRTEARHVEKKNNRTCSRKVVKVH